jgi:hypothetical protein
MVANISGIYIENNKKLRLARQLKNKTVSCLPIVFSHKRRVKMLYLSVRLPGSIILK